VITEARQDARGLFFRNKHEIVDEFVPRRELVARVCQEREILVAHGIELGNRVQHAVRQENAAIAERGEAARDARHRAGIAVFVHLDHQHGTLRGDQTGCAIEHGLLVTLDVDLDEAAIRNPEIVEPLRFDVDACRCAGVKRIGGVDAGKLVDAAACSVEWNSQRGPTGVR